MQVTIANGVLTTEHAASSYGQPVFVANGVAHGQMDMVDLGSDALDFLRYQPAAKHVESTYFLRPSSFTMDEYNLIAKFCGLSAAHE